MHFGIGFDDLGIERSAGRRLLGFHCFGVSESKGLCWIFGRKQIKSEEEETDRSIYPARQMSTERRLLSEGKWGRRRVHDVSRCRE